MKEEILQYVNDELIAEAQGVQVTYDDELLIAGHIDSLGLVRLLAFVEDSFGLRVPPRDVTIENFGNVEQIVAYLGRLNMSTEQG